MSRPSLDRADESRLRGVYRWWQKLFRTKPDRAEYDLGEMQLRFVHGRFREILNLNDSLLRLFADVQEKASGRTAFAYGAMTGRIRQGLMDGFVLAKDLNQLAGGQYPELYDLLEKLQAEAAKAEQASASAVAGPLVASLKDLRRNDVSLAGAKMAGLGEISLLGLAVPDGFVATTVAFHEFMRYNELDHAARELDSVYEVRGYEALERAAQAVVNCVIKGSLPPPLEDAILQAYQRMAGENRPTMAVRSSAVGEDSAMITHAGQYLTLLHVQPGDLIDAYRRVIASAFTPQAVVYRYQHGLTYDEATMAVGFLKMLSPRFSGVLFTRDFQDIAARRMRISVVAGLGDKLVSGHTNAQEIVIDPSQATDLSDSCIGQSELAALISAGELLEQHFGSPQDIEWAFDNLGVLNLLQSRPMAASVKTSAEPQSQAVGESLISGGQIACPGVGQGFVFKAEPDQTTQELPEGSVLVLRRASASFAYLFPRCAALLAETGSPSSHMAVLCREAGLPALVGLPGVYDRLSDGKPVIVNASAGKVNAGPQDLTPSRCRAQGQLAASPAATRLRAMETWITPLNLTDPSADSFRAGECRTLHDLVRFIHEKLYAVMFNFGEKASRKSVRSWKLGIRLPIEVLVTDLGGGLNRKPALGETLCEGDIACQPFQVFLEGLKDPRIDWTKPRSISGTGFMSVVGASMTGPPPDTQDLMRPSFVVLAHQYMSFSVRAGYHFSVIEAVCSSVENKNFIQYRFGGGGAAEERRVRRASFLWQVLSRLGFTVQIKGDLVSARVLKAPEPETSQMLQHLGRLTLCSRQLDMLMDSDDSPGVFATAFLEGRFDQF